jgi:hypothetical protein
MPIMKFTRCLISGAVIVLISGHAIAAPPPPGMVIEAFDLFDTSIDHRPAVIADQKQWLTDAATDLTQKLDAGGKVAVIDTTASHQAVASIAQSYEHPSTCRSCIMAAAQKLGARYVFIGSVHKVSDLIIYMRGELDRIGDPQPLMVESMEVKADNKTMIRRAAGAMAEAIGQHLG